MNIPFTFQYTVGGGSEEHTPRVRVVLEDHQKRGEDNIVELSIMIDDVSPKVDLSRAIVRVSGEADLYKLITKKLSEEGLKGLVWIKKMTFPPVNERLSLLCEEVVDLRIVCW